MQVSRVIPGPHDVSRREFTVESVLALLAGVTITITGCGSSSSPTSPSTTSTTTTTTTPPATTQQDVTGAISANHGHVATVSGATITQGVAVVGLDIRGQATHTHTISLTADQVRAIGAKQQVAVTSTTDVGHDHTVTFN